MSYSIKPHLPLITNQIEFEFNILPPPPQITARRDLGAHIRRQVRHNSAPYSRSRRAREQTPARSHSVGFDLRSRSPWSQSPDSEDSGSEDNGEFANETPTGTGTIPKPEGAAGRRNSGGYNLQEALGWDDKRFAEFTKYINDQVQKKLDTKKCYSKQNIAARDEVIESTAKRFKIQGIYFNDWPIRDALKSKLKNSSDSEKKRVQKRTEANLKKALNGSNDDL